MKSCAKWLKNPDNGARLHKTLFGSRPCRVRYNKWSGRISRVLFAAGIPTAGDHLSGPTIARRLPLRVRPTRASGVPGRHLALFGLAGGGVYPAGRLTPHRGALLPHHFTLA